MFSPEAFNQAIDEFDLQYVLLPMGPIHPNTPDILQIVHYLLTYLDPRGWGHAIRVVNPVTLNPINSTLGPFKYLVGGKPTPLKNMKVNWDYYSTYMET